MGNKIFAKRIRELRVKKELTLEQLGTLVELGKTTVANWEKYGAVPSDQVLKILSNVFGESIDYLLGNDISDYDEKQVNIIFRNMKKMTDEEIDRANNMLKAGFPNYFDEEEVEDV